MFRMRTRVSLPLVALALISIPSLAFAQIEARLSALDEAGVAPGLDRLPFSIGGTHWPRATAWS